MTLCCADPPGWISKPNGSREWHNGGSNYHKPHVPVNGTHNDQPTTSCSFCGAILSEG